MKTVGVRRAQHPPRLGCAIAVVVGCTPLVGQATDAGGGPRDVEVMPDASGPPADASRAACLGAPLAQPGTLLPSAPGWILVPRGGPGLQARAMVRDRRGGLVVAGYAPLAGARGNYDALLWRFDASLAPDRAFGALGVIQVDAVAERPGVDVILDAAVGPSGALVFAGWNAVATPSGNRGVVIQLRPEGDRLDEGFGAQGVATIGLAKGFAPSALHVDARGVLLLGTHLDNFLGGAGVAARLDAQGAPDTSFGVEGALLVPDAAAFRDAVSDGDGYLLLGATPQDLRPTLTRIDANGAVDPRFGAGGRALHPGGRDLAPLGLRRIEGGGLVALTAYIPVQNALRGLQSLVRFDDAGGAVSAYGRSGVGEDRVGMVPAVAGGARMMAVQCDGAVVTVSATTTDLSAVHRFTPGGNPDPAFGRDGAVLLPRLSTSSWGGAVMIDADGRSALVLSYAGDGRLGLHRIAL